MLEHTKAERLSGKQLDKRRRYCVNEGEVCFTVKYSNACKSCGSGNGFLWAFYSSSRGSGCKKCGYSGRVRYSIPVPVSELMPLKSERSQLNPAGE